MAAHNPQFQIGENGPLKPAVRKRLDDVKDQLNLTLAEVGSRLGFSGPFVSGLLKDSAPSRVRTKHINRIIAAIEQMEVEAGTRPAPTVPASPPSGVSGQAKADLSISELIQAAHKLGFEVSFKPL